VDGTVVTGGHGRLGNSLVVALDNLGVTSVSNAVQGEKYKGLVFDATGLTHSTDLIALEQFFTPLMRSLTANARVVVLGTIPDQTDSNDERVAQRALEGFTRSLGKEIGKGSTVNLVYVAPGAEDTLESTLSFFLSPKSAYVSGQVARLGATGTTEAVAVADAAKPLAGKVAIVTGASRGIGRAIASGLAAGGATVVIGYRSGKDEAETLAAELGGRAVQADVSNPDDAKRLVEEAGDLDILVNNAGLTRDGLLARMSDDDWRTVIETNLSSVFYTCRAVCRPMMKKRAGAIVNVSSIVGLHGNWGQTNYAASKAGIIGFTKSLARELGSRGVRANVVAPGYVQTRLTDVLPDEVKDLMLKNTPLGRLGDPPDVARAVRFLCSDDASFITGEVLLVDGGLGM
jgi:3-oxoacyl-[acyl-carrier protein] reductase